MLDFHPDTSDVLGKYSNIQMCLLFFWVREINAAIYVGWGLSIHEKLLGPNRIESVIGSFGGIFNYLILG